MPRSSNQKLKLLRIYNYLLEYTDGEHTVTAADIIKELERYGISAERKSIYSDLEALADMGVDVQKSADGWFIGEREFDLPELKLLVDAVQSSKFITHKKTLALIKKIEGLASIYDAQLLQRQVYVSGRIKVMNESIYYSVDLLHEAIARNSQISFRYFDWNLDGGRRYRPGKYTASPYALCWQDENYYLIAHSERHGLTHYRVDKMASISLTGEPRYMDAQMRDLDLSEYGKNVFGMFAGSREQLRLRFDRSLTGVVIDRFGRGTPCVPDGPDAFVCTVEVAVSPNFFGWLASFGARAQLLSPAPVREAFVTLCRAAETANT